MIWRWIPGPHYSAFMKTVCRLCGLCRGVSSTKKTIFFEKVSSCRQISPIKSTSLRRGGPFKSHRSSRSCRQISPIITTPRQISRSICPVSKDVSYKVISGNITRASLSQIFRLSQQMDSSYLAIWNGFSNQKLALVFNLSSAAGVTHVGGGNLGPSLGQVFPILSDFGTIKNSVGSFCLWVYAMV